MTGCQDSYFRYKITGSETKQRLRGFLVYSHTPHSLHDIRKNLERILIVRFQTEVIQKWSEFDSVLVGEEEME